MIDIEELELEFKTFYGDKENEHTLLTRIHPLIAEVKRLRKRNEWLEEVVGLAQEHWGIDLSDHREWPQWREEE